MNFHSQRHRRLSVPEWMWIVIGIRLIKNEALTVFVIVVGVFLSLLDSSGKMIGVVRITRVSSVQTLRAIDGCITFTWICTKMGGS